MIFFTENLLNFNKFLESNIILLAIKHKVHLTLSLQLVTSVTFLKINNFVLGA